MTDRVAIIKDKQIKSLSRKVEAVRQRYRERTIVHEKIAFKNATLRVKNREQEEVMHRVRNVLKRGDVDRALLELNTALEAFDRLRGQSQPRKD